MADGIRTSPGAPAPARADHRSDQDGAERNKNAITAVERGAHNVDRGVEVSNEAERALKRSSRARQKSTNMVRAIARATVEQSGLKR